MKIINYELPNTIYTISPKIGSNSFFVNDKLICLISKN